MPGAAAALRQACSAASRRIPKGYGRITADDGEVLFVHFSGIVGEGFRSLEEGDRVSFTWRGGVVDHGRHVAENVRREY